MPDVEQLAKRRGTMNRSESVTGARTVRAEVNYVAASTERPRFYANDHSRDFLPLDPREVDICDARTLPAQPTLAREGIEIIPFPASIANWRDTEELTQSYLPQVRRFMLALTGADDVVVMGRAVLRFAERSRGGRQTRQLLRSRLHPYRRERLCIAGLCATDGAGGPHGTALVTAQHLAHVLRPPSGCAPGSVRCTDGCRASAGAGGAVFDTPGQQEWTLEALLLRYDPSHRWLYYSNMLPEEALVFKRHDTDSTQPCYVPHTAFRDSSAPEEAVPRASVEARSIAYWFG